MIVSHLPLIFLVLIIAVVMIIQYMIVYHVNYMKKKVRKKHLFLNVIKMVKRLN